MGDSEKQINMEKCELLKRLGAPFFQIFKEDVFLLRFQDQKPLTRIACAKSVEFYATRQFLLHTLYK